MIELTAYVPMANTTIAKYLAPVLSVAQPNTKPNTAMLFATVICHVRSFLLPDEADQKTDMIPAIRYGGQVRTSVIVLLKPSVSTAVGKKFLKPLAARCMCCMNTNNHNRGSAAASFRPAQVLDGDLAPTVSRRIRSCASWRSDSVSQRVWRGSSGRVNAAAIATTY